MSDQKIVQALMAFMATHNGVPVNVGVGDLFYDDDPIVKGRADMFGDLEVRSTNDLMRRPRAASYAAPETAVAPPTGQFRSPVTKTGKVAASSGARPAGEV